LTTFCDYELNHLDDETKSNIFFGKLKNTYIEYYGVTVTNGEKYSMVDRIVGEKYAYEGSHLSKVTSSELTFNHVSATHLYNAYLTPTLNVAKEIKSNLDKIFKGEKVYFCVVKLFTVSEPIYE
jgi:hypothetical protein